MEAEEGLIRTTERKRRNRRCVAAHRYPKYTTIQVVSRHVTRSITMDL